MELNEDAFWGDLRVRAAKAEAALDEELGAAETTLDELEGVPVEPLSAERIDAIVRFAAADAADVAEHEDRRPVRRRAGRPPTGRPMVAPVAAAVADPVLPTPPATIHTGRVRHRLAAAAAFLLAPKVLLATTAITAVTVTGFMIKYSTFTLPYQDAIALMMQEDHPEPDRRSGQRRVSGDLIESILVLQQVSSENSAIASEAAALLDRLRQTLEAGGTFSPTQFPDSLSHLTDRVADTGLSFEQRQDALRDFSDLLLYGMLALKAAEHAPAPDGFRRDNMLWRAQLAALLGQ